MTLAARTGPARTGSRPEVHRPATRMPDHDGATPAPHRSHAPLAPGTWCLHAARATSAWPSLLHVGVLGAPPITWCEWRPRPPTGQMASPTIKRSARSPIASSAFCTDALAMAGSTTSRWPRRTLGGRRLTRGLNRFELGRVHLVWDTPRHPGSASSRATAGRRRDGAAWPPEAGPADGPWWIRANPDWQRRVASTRRVAASIRR